MQWIPVVSTDIASVGFDEDKQILGIEFGRGRRYYYQVVPRDVFDGFLTTASPGRLFRMKVLNQYPFSRVPSGLALIDGLDADIEEFEAEF